MSYLMTILKQMNALVTNSIFGKQYFVGVVEFFTTRCTKIITKHTSSVSNRNLL